MDELKNNNAISLLVGKIANLVEEEPGKISDTSNFKNLVAGGTALVKRMRQDLMNYDVTAKFMFSCNEIPRSDDKSDAVSERLIFVDFPNRFTAELGNVDVDLPDKIAKERSGVLNYILNHLREIGGIPKEIRTSNKTKQLSGLYKETNNNIYGFIKNWLEVYRKADPEFIEHKGIKANDMYKKYRIYCEQDSSIPQSVKNFGSYLTDFFRNEYNENILEPNNMRKTRSTDGFTYKGMKYKDDALAITDNKFMHESEAF